MKASICKILVTLQTLFSFSFAADISNSEIEKIAIESYIYGYPLVTMDLTQQVMTNVKKVDGLKAPVGQFVNLRAYPDATFKDVTAPNADTLYSAAFLDLSWEPYVLRLPDMEDRYYLMPLLSGWTDVFASLGTRTTGNKPQDYVITGPNWKGTVPSNLKEIKSPTDMVWILGRTYSTGTPEDYKIVQSLQDQYVIQPLSTFGKVYTPHDGTYNPNLDTKTPVRDQVNNLSGAEFFKRLAELMEDNPAAKDDAPIVAKMASIGIIPGKKFDLSQTDAQIVKIFENVPKIAQERITAHEKEAGSTSNGWLITTNTGNYGTDYLQRAFVAAFGLGANLPEDAIYPSTKVDSKGERLSGKNKYVIHFEKGDFPPVNGFWSLTMYNDQYFFVANPLNRYTLSGRNDFKYNEDGSLDLYVQNTAPEKDKESNWLPAPSDDFILMFRFYWPKEALIKGTWKPPFVIKQ